MTKLKDQSHTWAIELLRRNSEALSFFENADEAIKAMDEWDSYFERSEVLVRQELAEWDSYFERIIP